MSMDIHAGIIPSCDTTENWNRYRDFIPRRGELIVYLDHGVIERDGQQYIVPGFKVGDGNAYLIDLPFVNDDASIEISGKLDRHMADDTSHITAEERNKWNNKLNYDINEDTLMLNRL